MTSGGYIRYLVRILTSHVQLLGVGDEIPKSVRDAAALLTGRDENEFEVTVVVDSGRQADIERAGCWPVVLNSRGWRQPRLHGRLCGDFVLMV